MKENEKYPPLSKPITIFVDGERHQLWHASACGAHLKALVHRESRYGVYRKDETKYPHGKSMKDHEAYPVEDGEEFYTLPHASGGGVSTMD